MLPPYQRPGARLPTRRGRGLGWAPVGAEGIVWELASELGFDLVGVAPPAPPPAAARLEAWLGAGLQGGLDWMERERPRLLDPKQLLPDARSIVMVGLVHARPAVALGDGARVARYAAGRDYHNVLGKKLRRLRRRLTERGLLGASRQVVDAGPLMERSHAARAGLGFESKAANLLHHRFGPWFFLGGVLLDLELEPSQTPAPGSCGTCRACIDACPTGAILEAGVVDAGRCISYHTIENPGPAPLELRAKFGAWVFGCDVCSEVCPFGQRAPDRGERFGTHAAVETGRLVDWLCAPAEGHGVRFLGSPLTRTTRGGLARNAAIALGNRPSEEGRDALLGALEDPEWRVRDAALWALARGHRAEAGVPEALDRALARPVDAGEREGARATRAAAEGPA
ncbi:MAG: tRNA epoxyqueuosine(34) reductase QueG [Planctomycetaceae bacterium]|nr:tRNA epoxyqueuosine(34) reductase QueG [Planctomycetaceae bacterium]